MNDCEHYEVLISTWLDGEIERAEQVELLDHFVRCSRCRGFYLDARSLAGLVAVAGETSPAEAPSPEVWERIDRAALRAAPPGWAWTRRLPQAALAAAAAVLLVAFGGFLSRARMPSASSPAAGTAIRLGEDAGRMNDARFVELTAEVLRADRRYRAAFFEVMRQVAQDTADDEASADISLPEGTGREETAVRETRGSRS